MLALPEVHTEPRPRIRCADPRAHRQIPASWGPSAEVPSPRANRILANLPADACQRIVANLEPVVLAAGETLYQAGCKRLHVYFPTTSIVSLVCDTAAGASSEICTVGNEGVVGFALFMGGETTCSRAVVSSAGHAYRLPSPLLRREFDHCGSMMQMLLRYTQVLLTQMGQTAVCNRHHSVEQQLCRRLLVSLDRLSTDELTMTHELIAHTLGVRREGVTESAGRLQAAGVIRYSRGRIKILDRDRLEERACECYAVVKHESDRLMAGGLRAVARTA